VCRKYSNLLTTLGDLDGTTSRSYQVRDKNNLDKLLDNPDFAEANRIQLVDVVMDKYDAPRALKAGSELYAKRAEKY